MIKYKKQILFFHAIFKSLFGLGLELECMVFFDNNDH